MAKPQTFDIIAVSIPDSNVQMAVARLMVGADRYLSMQAALEKVKTPPVLLFHNTDTKESEQHVAKLKSLGVGFRIVRSEDGVEDDTLVMDEPLNGAPSARGGDADDSEPEGQAPSWRSLTDLSAKDPAHKSAADSMRDVIMRHRYGKQGGGDGSIGWGGGSGGGRAGGGGRGGALGGMLDSLKRSEEASRKKSAWVSIATAAIVVLLALLFYLVPKDHKFRVNKISLPAVAKEGKKPSAKQQRGNANTPAAGSGGSARAERRSDVDNRKRQQADNYVDSARTGGANADLEKQERFYLMAISFNRYNLQAWHGLLQTYRAMDKPREARETEKEMSEIFGDEVNSVSAAVTQFGELADAYASGSGSYKVEYKTKKTSRDEILRDIFNMTRAVRNTCKCQNITIRALTDHAGKSMTVVSTSGTSVRTLPEFSKQAAIIWDE